MFISCRIKLCHSERYKASCLIFIGMVNGIYKTLCRALRIAFGAFRSLSKIFKHKIQKNANGSKTKKGYYIRTQSLHPAFAKYATLLCDSF